MMRDGRAAPPHGRAREGRHIAAVDVLGLLDSARKLPVAMGHVGHSIDTPAYPSTVRSILVSYDVPHLFWYFQPPSARRSRPIRRPNAHAARHPRQRTPLRRADAGGWGVSFAGGARRPALPDAWRQGQRRAARQSQCAEAWCPLRPHPRDPALSARHRPRSVPPDAGGRRDRQGCRQGYRQPCRERRRHWRRIRKN